MVAAAAAACGVFGGSDATPTLDESLLNTPTPSGPTPEFPKTVTDLLGRDVTITARPDAIVAMSPATVELIYAVGAAVIGRPTDVTFPPEAATAADIGNAYQPDIDAVLALNPDLVIADSVIDSAPALRRRLEALGVPVIFAGAQNYAQVLTALETVGAATGQVSEAQVASDGVAAALAAAQAKLAGGESSAVVLVSDRTGTLYAALDSSFAGDLLRQLGIVNPAAEEVAAGPYPGYASISAASLAALDPDVIFTITTTPPPLAEAVAADPRLVSLAAVRQGNVVDLDPGIALQSPGPRVVELFDSIAAAVLAAR